MKKMKKSALAAAVLLSLSMMGASVEASKNIYSTVPLIVEGNSVVEIHEPEYTGVDMTYDLPAKDNESAVIRVFNGVLDINIPSGDVSLVSSANVPGSLRVDEVGKAFLKSDSITIKRIGGNAALKVYGTVCLDANTITFESDGKSNNNCAEINNGGVLYINQNMDNIVGTTLTLDGNFNVKNNSFAKIKAETINVGQDNNTSPFLLQQNANVTVEGKTVNFVGNYVTGGEAVGLNIQNGAGSNGGSTMIIKGLDGVNSTVSVLKEQGGDLSGIRVVGDSIQDSHLILKGNGANLQFNSGKIFGDKADVLIDFADGIKDTLQITSTSFDGSTLPVSINFDIDLSDTTKSDVITITGNAVDRTFNLGKINILAYGNVNSYQLITGDGATNVSFNTAKVYENGKVYTFENDEEHAGTIKIGSETKTMKLSDIVQSAEYTTYKYTGSVMAGGNLGELAGGAGRELTIEGDGNGYIRGQGGGVTVGNGQILNLVNMTMLGFSGNAVTNNGTVNTEKTVKIESDLTGTGNMNVGGTTTVTGDLEQSGLALADGAKMTVSGDTNVDKIDIGEGATIKAGKNLFSDTVTAIGSNNTMGAAHTYALGEENKVMGEKSVAVGFANEVNGKGSGAFGDPNVVYGDGSYAFGNDNKIGTAEKHADNSFAVGNNTTVSGSNSVALGNGSTVTEDNVVSVGSVGNERKIVNVKAGEADTDAVNYGQLKTATNMGTTAGNYYAANDSVVTAIGKVDTQVKTNTTAIATLQNAVGGTDGGLVKDVTDIQKYVKEDGLDANNKKVTNVADGTVAEGSTDAVNGGQLWAVDKKIDGIIGGDIAELENKVDSNVSALNNRIDRMGTRINKVGAGAAALAAMHPVYDEDSKLTFSAGLGAYRNEKAAAVGMFFRFSPRVMMNAGATVGNDNNMYNVGLNFALDRHVRGGLPSKAVMAKQLTAQNEKIEVLTAENQGMKNKMAEQDAKIAKLMAMLEELKNK